MIHRESLNNYRGNSVVNSFQNCILVDDSQEADSYNSTLVVVNSFQNCILVDDSQVHDGKRSLCIGCE
ncbi:hypothetical protein SAMN05444144_104305 [Flavobacterium akiainvivens]|nr:hypothetical protein SAMN05444144_104305 [Flavobacterium akiainvivens]